MHCVGDSLAGQLDQAQANGFLEHSASEPALGAGCSCSGLGALNALRQPLQVS